MASRHCDRPTAIALETCRGGYAAFVEEPLRPGRVLRRSFRLPGGAAAPRAARAAVRSILGRAVPARRLEDLELIVSELVTNSVRHADVGADDTLAIDVMLMEDRLLLCVVDQGSSLLPRILEPDAPGPGGLGLPLVERLSIAWGVARAGNGETRVWTEVPLSA